MIFLFANGIERYRLNVGDRIDQLIRKTERRYSSRCCRSRVTTLGKGATAEFISFISRRSVLLAVFGRGEGRVAEAVFLDKDDAAAGVISATIA